MSESIVLYSTHVITRKELEEVILESGGVLTERGPVGRISQDRTKHVFIWLADEKPISGIDPIYGTYGPSTRELLRVKLGAEPRYILAIEIGQTPGSGLLAVRFALACTQHWPCVVLAESFEGEIISPPLDNILDPIQLKGEFVMRVFDQEEILQLQREGKGFIAHGM